MPIYDTLMGLWLSGASMIIYDTLMASRASIPIEYTLVALRSLHANILYTSDTLEPACQNIVHLWRNRASMTIYYTAT